MGKYLKIFTVILVVIQFISIYFSGVPLFTTLCFLFTSYCCFSMFFVVSKYKYFIIRNYIRDLDESEFNIGFRLFSMAKVIEKNINGFSHYVVLGVRYDVSKDANGGILYNSSIPTDQFPLFASFDIFISPVNPETFIVKNKDRRPKLIKNIFSKTYIHTRKTEKEKDSLTEENKEYITSLPIPYIGNIDVHYNFTVYSIHKDSLDKELSNKIRKEIKNYITSKKFLKDEFNYPRN